MYNIIGRGNLQHTERVELSQPQKEHNITLKPTFLHAPHGRIYAYYVDETGEFRYAEDTFHVDVELQNQLAITAPEEVKPGESVTLQIKTAPHSFVALTAVDQSVLLLGANNDLDKNSFSWRLGRYDTHTPWQGGYSYFPGERSGVVTMTNANFFYNRTAPVYFPRKLKLSKKCRLNTRFQGYSGLLSELESHRTVRSADEATRKGALLDF